ncbi:hypothetical protein [Piscinibacter gummiphilus]|uniref:Uncharacterized protein n=1 Tax=Piscinibacter gummiphilus TaxID=946333 RepID=A0A1W6L455_9BURK|nr:hypothetical protein [Piscinibacter gummiphilus]ARN19014.1 hypothetical protein A4W93_03255 [Piscinibacter gummiphilus]ATU63659.1 hypothetical protein CPZ87_03330 [Piscinibacter gummiphilus]GLS93414.1 hypothetical protein GCM10007918_07050 [Piscinibacter gummiphilus]
MPGFIEDFDPSRGDLVYGVTTSRSVMMKRWTDHWGPIAGDANDPRRVPAQQMINAQVLTTCDHFNNQFELADPASYTEKKLLKGKLGDKAKLTSTTYDHKVMDATQQKRMKAYAKDLKDSRFSPVKALGASEDKLAEEGANPDHWADELPARSQQAERELRAASVNVTQLAIRRACKFGIGLVATSKAFHNAKVHFLLDGLVMKEVVGNNTNTSSWLLPGTETKESVNITISELRYVYRNWGKLSNTVILYVNGNPVAAPWLSDWKDVATCHPRRTTISAEKAGWDDYGTQRLANYGNKLPKKPLL